MATAPKRRTICGRTYEARLIPTVDLKPGHVVTAAGVGMWVHVLRVDHLSGDVTLLTFDYEVWGRCRRAQTRRKTSGKTTIHVLVEA